MRRRRATSARLAAANSGANSGCVEDREALPATISLRFGSGNALALADKRAPPAFAILRGDVRQMRQQRMDQQAAAETRAAVRNAARAAPAPPSRRHRTDAGFAAQRFRRRGLATGTPGPRRRSRQRQARRGSAMTAPRRSPARSRRRSPLRVPAARCAADQQLVPGIRRGCRLLRLVAATISHSRARVSAT